MGQVDIKSNISDPITMTLDGHNADIHVGGAAGQAGLVSVYDAEGQVRTGLHPGQLLLFPKQSLGFSVRIDSGGRLGLGLGGAGGGEIELFDAQSGVVFHANAATGGLRVGTTGKPGVVALRDDKDQTSVRITGGKANVWIGGGGNGGDVVIHPSTVSNDAPPEMSSIHLSGDGSRISIKSGGVETIKLDGAKGDIILVNATAPRNSTSMTRTWS